MIPRPAPADARVIDFAGHPLALLPGKAAWHPPSRTLFVADVHFGKAASFRAQGLPVPAGTTQDNLARLDGLVRVHDAARLVFLGDLLHSSHAQRDGVLLALMRWRGSHAGLRCVLVRGNHDAHAGDPPAALGFVLVDEPWPVPGADGLFACHHPRRMPGGGVLAGHWHPAITLRGPARDRQRLACFCLDGMTLVLPAFGAFTGSGPQAPPAGSLCYPIGGARVWPAVPIG
ncbi:MAG: ligase-associated DNA damage response endonuclease PdeM [Burkholderiaceae bacterium]